MNKEFRVKILKNASLKDFCTFRIGGSANYVFIVENTYSLIKICDMCKENDIKFKVIGFGANLLFDDLGYNGAIVVNRSKSVKFMLNSVRADSGASVSSLIQKCIKRNLSGLESLAGIPSSVGGAVVNSLGAFNTNFTDLVDHVVCYDVNTKKIIKLRHKDCHFGYRTSAFKSNSLIILSVKLKLTQAKHEVIAENMKFALKKKSESQPLNLPSAGSVFKRGNIIPASVIDELGLKGTRIGDAEISTKHAGFIVNLGLATSEDVKKLIDLIKTRVFEETSETLETEIEFVPY